MSDWYRTDKDPKDQWPDDDGAGCFVIIFVVAMMLLCIWALTLWGHVL